jgi:anaerobic selenocysteine-containing dehydrogenase
VLPAKAAFEKTGTTTNLAGDVLPVNAAKSLESPDGALSDLEMIIGLAEQLGVELPSAADLDETIIKRLAAEPETFTFGDERFARVAAAAPDGAGLNVVLQTKIFAGGGTSAHDDRLAELRPLPEAALSAADATALGVQTGDYIDVECASTVIHDLLVDVRENMPAGVIALIDGLPDDPANCFPENAKVQVTNVRKAHALQPDLVGVTQ